MTQQKRSGPSMTGGRPRSTRSWPSTSEARGARRRRRARDRRRRPRVAARIPGARRREELRDRRLEVGAVLAGDDPHPDEALRAEAFARSTSASRRARPSSAPPASTMPRTTGGSEGVELGVGEHLGEVDELHREAQVGLVRAVPVDRLVPGHLLDRRAAARRSTASVASRDGLGDDGADVVLGDEGGLDVELGELELAVRAQVLVAHAAGDLVSSGRSRRPSTAAWRSAGDCGARRTSPAGGGTGSRTPVAPSGVGVHNSGVSSSVKPWRSIARAERASSPSRGAAGSLHPLGAQVQEAVAQPDLSSVSARPSIENGGGSASERISTVQSPSSTSPVGSAGFTVPFGRSAHRAGHPHDELRAQVRAPPSTTHWTMPGVVPHVHEREVLAVLAPVPRPSRRRSPPARRRRCRACRSSASAARAAAGASASAHAHQLLQWRSSTQLVPTHVSPWLDVLPCAAVARRTQSRT